MMISSPAAGASYAATAALDRASSAPSAGAADTSSTPDAASPDVVVTLSGGQPPAASTYDATGRLPGGPSLNDLGANGPTSLAHATEALASDDGGDDEADASPDVSNTSDATTASTQDDAVAA